MDIEAELDADLAIGEDGEDVDNWLIDDIGGGLEDKPDHGKSGLREVGEFFSGILRRRM